MILGSCCRSHLGWVSPARLRRLPGCSAAAESLQWPQQLVLPGPVGNHEGVLLQQDAVQRALVVDVAARHHNVLLPQLQQGAVTGVGSPQELAVLQTEAVAVGVEDLDVVPRLLAYVQLPEDSTSENCQKNTGRQSQRATPTKRRRRKERKGERKKTPSVIWNAEFTDPELQNCGDETAFCSDKY